MMIWARLWPAPHSFAWAPEGQRRSQELVGPDSVRDSTDLFGGASDVCHTRQEGRPQAAPLAEA